MMASSSRKKNPIEMILIPYCSAGTVPSMVGLGNVCTFIRVGMVGPYTSASMMPTRAPVLASARARLAETVDFPTPPLPLATGITFFTDGMSRSFIGPGDPPTRAVIVTSTPPTPGRAATASRACCRMCSRTGDAGVVCSMVNPTVPSETRTSFTNPRVTMSRPRSGSVTTRSASRTWLSLICGVSARGLLRQVYGRGVNESVGAVVVPENLHGVRIGVFVPRHWRCASSAPRHEHDGTHQQEAAHQASSEGAPWTSQSRNDPAPRAMRHSSKIDNAIARMPPSAGPAAAHCSSSHASKSSGSGSAATARSSRSRLMASPITSGVVSRLRRFRRPSDASTAASSSRQTSPGLGGWWRLVEDGGGVMFSHPPPTSTNFHNLQFQTESRPLGPMIATIKRRDVQGDGRDIVQQHAPPGQLAHRGLRFHISLTRVAHLDLARGLPVLGRQISQILVTRFGAEGTAQPGHLPTDAAPPAPQPTLPLEPAELRERGPGAAQGTIAFPPGRRYVAANLSCTCPEQRHGRDLRHDAERGRIACDERIDTRIILTDRSLQQIEWVKAVSRAVKTCQPRELADEAGRGAAVHADLDAVQQRRACRTTARRCACSAASCRRPVTDQSISPSGFCTASCNRPCCRRESAPRNRDCPDPPRVRRHARAPLRDSSRTRRWPRQPTESTSVPSRYQLPPEA